AADAVRDKVATPDAIDQALRFGVNYPFGPLEWAAEFGAAKAVAALDAIADETGDALYRPNEVLRKMAGADQ
ncbi:MAG: 3-hydroxyacyl-CoA dehydrogenase family protein, partial [Pseudomonadota bacterium]